MRSRKGLVAAGVVLLALVVVGLLFGRSGRQGPAVSTNGLVAGSATNKEMRVFAPAPQVAASAVAPAAEAPLSPRGTKTVRITADRTMTADLRAALEKSGARIISSVGGRAVLVEATPAASRAIAGDSRFTVEDVLPERKVQPELATICRTSDAAVSVTVLGLSEADRASLTAFVCAAGGEILRGPADPLALYASVKPGTVDELAARGDVRWIEYNPPTKLFNDLIALEGASNVDEVRAQHILRGRGQTVVVCDSGFDAGTTNNCHLDFGGRVEAIHCVGKESAAVWGYEATPADCNGHGTHVSGTLLGNGARSDGQYKGMAPEAHLVMLAAGDTEGSDAIWIDWSYERLFTKGLEYGSYIHSDSWGSGTNGAYNTKCQWLDAVQWKHPEILVVVAAGNDGKYGRCTVGAPGAAKSALTVGNAQSTRASSVSWQLPASPENLNPTSSRGPTQDGRLKPEIAAPGTEVVSALSSRSPSKPIAGNRYYTTMTGTSMATPLVSGAATLVREWLLDRRGYAGLPTAALLKAILTGGGVVMTGKAAFYDQAGSAYDLSQTLPNSDVGWGRLDLEETLYPTNGRAVRFVDRIPFHDGVTETIDLVTTADAPLDVQLCWLDYPADPSASQTLVNDLDLIVSNKTTGALWYGNGVTGGDHTNTTESVRIPFLEAGEYAVLVCGYAVPHDSDEGGGAAAVYIRGAFADETAPDPLYILNSRTGVNRETLEESVAAGVTTGDVLKVCRPVQVRHPVSIGVDCTIVATNDDPTAASLTRVGNVRLAVESDATLTLTNLLLTADDADTVSMTVAAGAHLALAGKAGAGRVVFGGSDGLVFGGGIDILPEAGLAVDCATNALSGMRFGTYDCDYLAASNAALRVVNPYDPDLGGFAVEGTGQLVWSIVPVLPDVARVSLETEEGLVYYRTFERLMRDARMRDSVVTLLKRDVCTNTCELVHDFTLTSSAGTTNELSLSGAAGFNVKAGTMILSNVLVRGADAELLSDAAFFVKGGSLTLSAGATLENLCGRHWKGNDQPYGGAIVVYPGTVTMGDGSRIAGCHSYANGGAIWLGGAGCRADLLGGLIENCSANNATGGGAVYAAKGGSVVNVAGSFTATDNTMGTQKSLTAGNLYLAYDTVFTLVDEATGRVGVSFSVKKDEPDRNFEDAPFVTVDPGVSEEAATASASRFVSDVDDELYGRFDDVEGAICWLRVQADGQVRPSYANVIVEVEGESDPRYYAAIDDAFAYVKGDAAFCLLQTDWITHDVEIFGNVRLIGDGDFGETLAIRVGDAVIHVAPGGSLSVSNIAVSCASHYFAAFGFPTATKSIFSVEGGSLTLERGAIIGGIYGDGSRAANAISVWNGGTMTMLPGSCVSDCHNLYSDPAVATGCGGGVLADRSILYLRGGEIEFSSSYRGGGLCVANGSTAYISGNFVVTNNTDLSGASLDNITVSRNSQLIVDDAFAGAIGYNEGIKADTNWFGTVTWDWPSVEALTNCAARFVHDKTGARGAAVTNGVDKTAVLVWSDWLSRAGRYVSPDGDVYRVCLAPGQTFAVPRDFSVAPTTTADGRRILALDGGVDGCWYTVWSTESLAEPFVSEKSVHLKAGETFEFEIDPTAASKFYKVVAEEGIK